MLICDTHADTLHALAARGFDVLPTLDVTKERLLSTDDTRVQIYALFVGANGMRGEDASIVDRMLNAFERLKADDFVQITDISEARSGRVNAMLSIEGGEAFGADAASVERFTQIGVRIAALVWNNENLLAYPAFGGGTEGLKPFGREIVKHMRACHMAVDLSHLNERGTWDVLEGDIPPMASHSCAKALCDHPRNLSDAQLRAIFAAGGYVGVNFYACFLSKDGHADIDRVIDHMVHMCNLGGENAVGLGSDFDGIDVYPEGLRHAGQLPALFQRMRERGFDEPLVAHIAGMNLKRYMARL